MIVSYTQTPEEEWYANESKKEMANLGFNNIELINMQNPVDTSTLDNFDVIYVCGGNTFSILEKLRETGLDKFIPEQVKNGSIYVGVSAGSILAGPSIETAGWGSEGDENEVGLQDLTGFNLTNISIYPHFTVEQKDDVEEIRKKADYEVIEVMDGQAVFVDEEGFEVL